MSYITTSLIKKESDIVILSDEQADNMFKEYSYSLMSLSELLNERRLAIISNDRNKEDLIDEVISSKCERMQNKLDASTNKPNTAMQLLSSC